MRLLFRYMDAVDKAGRLLKRRLGGRVRFREQMDSHPTPSERLLRLDAGHLGEHPPTSQLLRYADGFFAEVLTYVAGLDDVALEAPLQGIY